MPNTKNGHDPETTNAGYPSSGKEKAMIKNAMLLKLGIGGAIIAALCCFTPILVVLLGIVGLSALTGYLDYVLLPALALFVGITLYALLRKHRQMQACCSTDNPGEKS